MSDEILEGNKINIFGEQGAMARFRRLIIILVVAALVTIGFYLWLNIQTGAWQMLVAAGAVGLELVLLGVAYGLARREKRTAAGYVILSALAIICAVSELSWSGATVYIAAGGVLLILFAGSIVLPHKWQGWIVIAILYGIWILLVNQFEPIPRFDVEQSVWLNRYILGVNTALTIAMLWQIVRAFSVGTIRARLLITSVVTILLTAIAIRLGSMLIEVQAGQQQAIDRLEVVATLREVEVEKWIEDVQRALAGSLQQAPEQRFVESGMANVVATLLDSPSNSEEHREAYDFLVYNFDQWMKQAQQFEVVFFMDRDGKVLVSTDPTMEGQILPDESYFQEGARKSYVTPLQYSHSLDRAVIFTSRPILGEYGRLLGVLAARFDASTLNSLMQLREQTGLGETGESYLISRDHTLLTDSRFSQAGVELHSQGINAAIEQQLEGFDTYDNHRGDRVIGVYRWLPDLQVALMAEQSRSEALRSVRRTMMLSGVITILATVAAGGVSLLVARSIGDPLSDLAQTASQIASGDLGLTAHVERRDEIGTLAQAFNSMTTQLRELIGSLEKRVAERTFALEQRSAYLAASAEIGRVASSILDIDELIRDVVDLIQEEFDLYYVGLFLLGGAGEWARLRAGTGEAGQRMIAQEHKLKVGGDSMIGQCVAQGKARIALDVGEEAVRFDNPHLPETRSEAALPLRSRGRVFGAITVQSVEEAAFNKDIITVLQTMADQVTVAIDNARLFAESQETLEAAQRAYGELSREAWEKLLRAQSGAGYRSDKHGVTNAEHIWRPEMEQALREQDAVHGDGVEGGEIHPLAVPIKVRGHVIGVLDTYKPEDAGAWAEEEINVLETLAEELGEALESARLYQDTQRRAARERLTGEVAARIRESLDVDTVLRTAVREMRSALDLEEAEVQMVGELRSSQSDDEIEHRS